MDNRCPKGNRPSHTILSKSQSNCDDHPKKTQTPQKKLTQPQSSSFSRSDSSKTFEKKARKEKKKKYHREYNRDSGTLATNVNADNVTSSGVPKDMSLITCFNYDKTGHQARNCPKPKCNSSKAPKN